MSIRYQKVSVTGAANTTVLDAGLESTGAEPKKLLAVWIFVTGQIGNDVEVWIDQERILQIPDYLFITDETTGAANVQKATNRLARVPIDRELAQGERAYLGLNCGATAKNLFGCYEYEIVA